MNSKTGNQHSPNIDFEIDFAFDLESCEFLQSDKFHSEIVESSLGRVCQRFLEQGILSGAASTIESIVFECDLVDDETIKNLNSEYRQKDSVTDVISLANFQDLRVEIKNESLPVLHLGSVHICREKVFEQAAEFKISPAEEFVHLLIHGFLHLLGYDHEISEKEEKLMEEKESQLIDEFSRLLK